MTLRQRFSLIIILTTLICIAGISVGLANDISNFWKKESHKKIVSSRENLLTSIKQFTETAQASTYIIGEDELISRYFAAPEHDRYVILYPTVIRYLGTILDLYPSYEEVTLLLNDGFEDVHVSRSNKNISEINKSPLVKKAWNNPQKSFIDFEYNENTEHYGLNLYQAVKFIDRSVSSRKKKVQAVVRISMRLQYLEEIAQQKLFTDASFIAIHNDSGRIVMSVGNAPPNIVDNWLLQRGMIEGNYTYENVDYLIDSGILFDEWKLLVGVPFKEAFKSIDSIVLKGAITLLVFFVALGVSVFLMLSRTIITPLSDLVKVTNSFSPDGDLPEFPRRYDEIGTLQFSFTKMAKNIKGKTLSLRKQAFTDSLTGLPNRNLLPNLLSYSLEQAKINNSKVGLLFIDLDGFKKVNDVLGHDNGDKLLQEVAIRLNAVLRESDSFYQFDEVYENDHMRPLIRLGGDEFTIVLPDIHRHDIAAKISQRIIDQFLNSFEIGGRKVFVGVSIGISFFPDDSKDASDLVKYADTAMYAAKSRGKMCFCFFSPSMFKESESLLQLENILHTAVSEKSFWPAFQAKVDPKTQKVVGFEILARLTSKDLGFIQPNAFIPIAEKIGIIDHITLFLIEKSCEQINFLERELGRDFTIAINITPSQLGRDELFLDALDIVRKAGLSPGDIELEITENSLIEHENDAEKNLIFLKNIGFKTALDDFGVGYSSLGHLKRYPFDTLKIDQIFFQGIEDDESGKVILISIIKLAQKLGMTIVAEGIEISSQLEFVIENNVDLVQGYIYSKPLKGTELVDIIANIESKPSSIHRIK